MATKATKATNKQRIKLINLIDQLGGISKAIYAIQSVKRDGHAPSISGLNRAYHWKRNTSGYVVQCYIDDLEKALGVKHD